MMTKGNVNAEFYVELSLSGIQSYLILVAPREFNTKYSLTIHVVRGFSKKISI